MDVKLKNTIWAVAGIGCILWGVMALVAGMILPAFGIRATWLEAWRYWPLIIVGVGDFLGVLALGSLRKPGMGAIFIPALPVMTTGALLFVASVFDVWHIWSFAWSLIILMLAFGFVLAMVTSRNIWFGIPAIVIGLNALAFTFCSFTGLWSWWSVLWVIEPLSAGLILLLVAYKSHSAVVGLVGVGLCAVAGVGFSAMSGLLLFGGWARTVFGPLLLILAGAGVVLWAMGKRPHLHLD